MQAQSLHPVECMVTRATEGDCVPYASKVPRSPRLLTRVASHTPSRLSPRCAVSAEVASGAAICHATESVPSQLRAFDGRGVLQGGQAVGAANPCATSSTRLGHTRPR